MNIELDPASVLTGGLQRDVFEIPGEGLLVKVNNQRAQARQPRAGLKGWLYSFFPRAQYRHMIGEYQHDQRIQFRAAIKNVRSPLAPTRGLVSTNLGIGLVVKKIEMDDGHIGLRTDAFIAQGLLDARALAALNEFARLIFDLGVVATDINPRNIIWGSHQGQHLPYLVDGYGDKNLIKLRSFLPWPRNRTLQQKLARFAAIIDLQWDQNLRQFTRP